MKQKIIDATDNPHTLEVLYRSNPKDFIRAFPDAFADRPDSGILQAWHERLFFAAQLDKNEPSSDSRFLGRDICLTVFLSLFAGTLVKLPKFLPILNDQRFYSRNLSGIVAGALIVYFCIQKSCRMKIAGTIIALLLAATFYLNLLPDKSNSQTVVLSCMHIPFFFWSLLGIAFLGGAWKDLTARMDYVRYNGELMIYSTIILIGGMVLTGLTFALFRLIDVGMGWYMDNVVVYGATATPIVATLLIERAVGDRFKIAPLLAKIFTPLFLLTVVAYLLAMIMNQKSPFTDRGFLIVFNGLLLVVLGLCVFSISERIPKESLGIIDIINIGLVSVTLVIDVVALAAILFRLTSYGFTPNRLAVLGANLLTFCHLTGIVYHYIRFTKKNSPYENIEKWIVGYIPAYTAWSILVGVGFPLAFRFH